MYVYLSSTNSNPDLQQNCPLANEVELIVTSPMRRTLQTALNGLSWLIERGAPIEVDAMWQGRSYLHRVYYFNTFSIEILFVFLHFRVPAVSLKIVLTLSENYDGPCDTGTDLDIIAAEFPEFDFSNVDPTYPDKSDNTPYAFRRSANLARGQSCLRKLYTRPENVIAVVSHSGFLRTTISKRRYGYADYRIFSFREDSATSELKLIEDVRTARTGGAMGHSPKGVQRIRPWDFPPENIEDLPN